MLTADFSRGLPDLRSGIYRHYKGHFYFVFGYGHDANAEDLCSMTDVVARLNAGEKSFSALGERAVVIYMGLELTEAQKGPRLAIRTAEDFFALVCSECGGDWECQIDHHAEPWKVRRSHPAEPVPRFEYMGPAWYGWPQTS